MPGAGYARSLVREVESTRVRHHTLTGQRRHSLRNGFNGLLRALPGEPGFLATIPAQCGALSRVNASVGASTARFPKFVRHLRPHFHELRKAQGSSKFKISVPLSI